MCVILRHKDHLTMVVSANGRYTYNAFASEKRTLRRNGTHDFYHFGYAVHASALRLCLIDTFFFFLAFTFYFTKFLGSYFIPSVQAMSL